MRRTSTLIIIFTIFLSSCMEKNTEDPIETFTLWGGDIPKEVEVIHGKYWQSSHWSKEYIMYLELKASSSWRKEFMKQNHLIENAESNSISDDAPGWFRPNKDYRILTPSGFSQGSTYYEDTLNGRMFIYEIQL